MGRALNLNLQQLANCYNRPSIWVHLMDLEPDSAEVGFVGTTIIGQEPQ